MVCPVAALTSVASFGPDGTPMPSGPGLVAGGWTQVEDMEAGMGSRATWGFVNCGGAPDPPPPVTWVTTMTTSAMSTTRPPTRTAMRICFWRRSAARFSAARRWLSALR